MHRARGAFRGWTFALAAAVVAGAARADIQVELTPGDRVAGSIAPADETETFRVAAARYSTFSAAVKGKKAKGVKPAVVGLRVYDPDGGLLAEIPATKNGAKWKRAVAVTGVHQFEVFGDGTATGNYEFAVSVALPKKVPVTGAFSGGAASVSLPLDRGSAAKVSVKGAGGALPRIARLVLDTDAVQTFTPPGGTSASDRQTLLSAPATAEFQLELVDAAAVPVEGATFAGFAQPKPPKPAPKHRLLDLRGTSIDTSGGAEGAILGTEGGTIETTDVSGVIGASIEVPPGALPYPSAIVLGAATPLTPPGGAAAAGPALFCGPDGLTFDIPVRVTLPFDSNALGGDLSRLVIYVRDASGKTTTVPPPYQIDAGAGTVTFAAAHFSSYGPCARAASNHDLNGDGFDDLVCGAPGTSGSRGAVYVFYGSASPPQGTLQVSKANATLTGEAAGRNLGRAYAVGDFDADGQPDLALSVGPAGTSFAEVRIYRGGPNFAKTLKQDDALRFPASTAADTDLGMSLASGDVTDDGIADLVVGDPQSVGGRVYVIPGSKTLAAQPIDSAGITRFDGPVAYGTFGQAVLAADVTGDSVADVVAGAPDLFGFNLPTRVTIWPGGAQIVSAPGSILVRTIDGYHTSDGFGQGLAAGDLDGDGFLDLVVGGWRRTESVVSIGGAIYVFDGPLAGDTSALAADLSALARTSFENFGRSIALLDTNNLSTTPYPLVIYAGANGRSASDTDSGALDILEKGTLLADDPPRGTLAGEAASDLFGDVFPPIDWNGDGRLDLIVGAPGAATNGTSAGRIYVYLGPNPPTAPRVRIDGPSPGSLLGLR